MTERVFHFSDDRSNKFWAVTQLATGYTVRFGRQGTAGQTQSKDFATAQEAELASAKLIFEKLKKGYIEVTPQTAGDQADVIGPEPAAPVPEAPSEPATVVSAQPAQSASLERQLDLEALDWLWVSGPPEQPWPQPSPAPFDRDHCLDRLAGLAEDYRRWEQARISDFLSPEEASFWLTAAVLIEVEHLQPAAAARRLASQPQEVLSEEQVRTIIAALAHHSAYRLAETAMGLLCNLPYFELLPQLWEQEPSSSNEVSFGRRCLAVFCERFHTRILPYLLPAQVTLLRAWLRPRLTAAHWPQSYYETPFEFLLAAQLGMADALLPVVASWPDDQYTAQPWHDHYHRPQAIIFGLGERGQMSYHFRRLKLKLKDGEQVRAWLALTGFDDLDIVRESALAAANKDLAEDLVSAFARTVAPEVAPAMFELMLSSKASRLARQWLLAHPQQTIAGLVPFAVISRSRQAEGAIDLLGSLAKRGFEPQLRAELARQEPAAAQKLSDALFNASALPPFEAATTPDWLKEGLARAMPAKKPITWVTAADLPPIAALGRVLNPEQTGLVLVALQQSKDQPQPLVVALKAHAEPASLDRFAWTLFERWLLEGGPSKENWAMQALGHFGSDTSALKLAPLIREWPGESQHQRAVAGLECLRAIGTDTALMQINGIAQKVKFQGIKKRAQECMEAIAQERHLSREQLEDRIVPDCGLDENGRRRFDFGPRQFTFTLGEGLKPLVRDSDGKFKGDLPKPGAKDSADLAQQAVADWKLIKKQVAEVAKIQAVRLEQAMVTGRRWQSSEFELLFVRHPLMNYLARLLVWGGFDASGQLVAAFRVSEDRTLADSEDNPFDLAGLDQVGIVHPLMLDEAQLTGWGQLFADYAIVPPFAQLGRPIYRLEAGER